MNDINRKNHKEEDEISLRELFVTLANYKWSIIFLTLIITLFMTIKIYLMPKYYKTSVTLEVKSESKKGAGFSLGGAGALLGLGGDADVSLEKDVTLLKTFRTNGEVLQNFNGYTVRYFIQNEKLKEREIDENLSIEVNYIKIKEFKHYGMKVLIEPFNDTHYRLLKPSIFFEKESIGLFEYDKIVETPRCKLRVVKKKSFKTPYTLQFSGTKRHIYQKIIKPNLSITINKSVPFITISLLDTLPKRAEAYLKRLIEVYTQQNIKDIKEDASSDINSYNRQLKSIEKRVDLTSNRLKSYKVNNRIIQPEAQASVLVGELSKVKIELAQNDYKKELIGTLISFVENNNDIDAIAPSLIELNDAPTIALIQTIQGQQLELSSFLMKYQPNHPNVVNTQSKINFLQNKILSNLKNFQRTLEGKNSSLNQLLNRYQSQIELIPQKEQKLISFSRDYQLNAKMYSYILQERSTAELKRDKAMSRFRIIEEIYTPDGAEKPKKALMVIITFISALIFSIFLSFFRNFLQKGRDDKKNK